MLALYEEELIFMLTIIFFFDSLIQELLLRRQLILIKHSSDPNSLCYLSGKIISMYLSVSFKEFLSKSEPSGTREQGGAEHFCKPNWLCMGSAKSQSTCSSPRLFSSQILFIERFKQAEKRWT